MKYLVVGLGNIGDEYAGTRHNIGFSVLDHLAEKEKLKFTHDRHAYVSEYKFKGRTFVLVKPTTFMNLSGKAVQYWMQAEKIPIENLLVITDDIALPFGTIRIKSKGGAGGHNGLTHIEETLQSSEYTRLRFGVGNEFPKGRQVEYVLGKWSEDQLKALPERLDKCCEAIKAFGTIGVGLTMTNFNGK
ncbi:MAG TPA: aminoacyl-tRNA hydrolase [Bacteroidia bacterium]|jgi:PTH1 family peptidyl-tRNA hydrolase|nr:aminoacyl-tRNA hydrolase [Bacteroidia bacterium]